MDESHNLAEWDRLSHVLYYLANNGMRSENEIPFEQFNPYRQVEEVKETADISILKHWVPGTAN